MMRKLFAVIVLFLACVYPAIYGQAKILDEVEAVLGDKKILYSDIQKGLMQLKESGENVDNMTSCQILEQLLVQKLLLNQAEVDSIEVTDSQIESELDSRMNYFINMFGTQEKFEAYW